MYWNMMLKLDVYFLQIVLKIHTFGENDKDKSFGEQSKPTKYLICLLISCVMVKISYENCQN